MKYLFIFLYVTWAFSLFAQTSTNGRGKITGRVIDSTMNVAVEYATISLFKQNGTVPVNGTTTDQKGNFTLSGLPDGDYRLSVDFMGYEHYDRQHVSVSQNTIVLPLILLRSSITQLKSVSVVGKAPVIENKIDKMVFNAANDITSQAGMASDVLKKVPMVTVDIDGNVELQGNSGVRFLINGKPSTMFGNSIANVLQTIPASQIKSIEVITSPGAKYDAAGTAGIINIILKSNNVQGFNGSINLSGGTRLENGSMSLNAKKGGLGIGAYFSGNAQLNTVANSKTDRRSFYADTVNFLTQEGSSKVTRSGMRTGLNFNWDINKQNNLAGSVGYDFSRNGGSNFTDQTNTFYKSSAIVSNSATLLRSTNHSKESAVDLSLEYKKTFKKEDEELGIQINSGIGHDRSFYNQQQSLLNAPLPFSGSTSTNPGKDNETEIVIDYVYPVSDNFTLETGAKTVVNTINSSALVYSLDKNTQLLVPDPSQSNNLDYKRQVYAFYLSGSYQLFDFLDVKSGLRYERTASAANYSQVGAINLKPYNTWAPSIVFAHTFTGKETVKLSYSYRIERPDYEDLNPFLDLSDPRNVSTGNPNLQPEIGNNFELGVNKAYTSGANLNVSLYYRHNGNDIKGYSAFYPAYTIGDSTYRNVTLTTRLNIGEELREGINVSASLPAGSKLTLRTNASFDNQIIVDKYTGGPNISGYRYRVNLNASYQVSSTLAAELFGNYNSSQNNIQGNRPAFLSYNLAIRKQVFNKKGSIGLSATNPFSKYTGQTTTVATANTSRVWYRAVPYRSFGITLSYRFGKLEFKNEKDENIQLPTPLDNGAN